MKLNKTNKEYYGLFYKSQGRWVGPYADMVGTKNQMASLVKSVKTSLKSKTQLCKLKFKFSK